MKICIFEDEKYEQFYPLTYLRTVFELRCGHTLLIDKIRKKFASESFCYFVREHLSPTLKARWPNEPINDLMVLPDDLLIINGRWLAGRKDDLPVDGPEEIGFAGDDMVYVRVKKQTVEKYLKNDFPSLLADLKANIEHKSTSFKIISYAWDLVSNNGAAIEDDFEGLDEKGIKGEFSDRAVVHGDAQRVYVAKNAAIHPFVVLDTKGGPVIIDEEAIVYPFTRIEGPACIGKGSHIFGAKVREGTSIGPVCRVGGEVEESILHGYSSKYHDGFLGHGYVCEWVNIGALATNSDLKNDYGQVQVYVKGELIDTHQNKVGCFIGDHTKTSIGSFLNTGSVVGVMSNVVGSGGMLPKFIPSFAWFVNNKVLKGYGFKMMVETAKVAVSRRGLELTEADIKLLEYTYQITKEERNKAVKKGRR